MNIDNENIEVNSDSLYTGYCLPNNLLNSLNTNNINSKNDLDTLNNCSNQVGSNSIYVGFKKAVKPSLYGLKLNIKCQNGENYICPIFNELSKKIMSKCKTVNGVVSCKLDSLTNNEKEEIQKCLNMASNECGLDNKIKVSYKCDNNNIVTEVSNIEDIRLECKNDDKDKSELCLGTSDNIEYNNYKMNINECSINDVPIYYNPTHKVDDSKIKEGNKNKLNYLYTKNYEDVKNNYDNYKQKKKDLENIEKYAEENNIEIENIFEKYTDDDSNNNTCSIQDSILTENIDEIKSNINSVKDILEEGDYYKENNELDIIKRRTENINRQIDNTIANNNKKKNIISLLSKLLLVLTLVLIFVIVYYGVKKGVIPKNTQNKIQKILQNQSVMK